jgi:sec-independent protein translocase protein TatB
MFDFGLSMGELMVIALIALIVVGPKDLPKMLRTIGKVVTRMRGMAGEFHRHLDAAIREAGIEDVKKEMRNLTNVAASSDIGKKTADELKKHENEIKKVLDSPAAPAASAAEPEHAASEPSIPAPEETKAQAS